MTDKFQDRINYKDNLIPLLYNICKDFNLGKYRSHLIIPIGYEDFNLTMTTNKGKYFIKIFASFRGDKECKRYVDIIKRSIEAGVSHPKLFESSQGYLYKTNYKNSDYLIITEYLDGKMFYTLKINPDAEDTHFIVKQAALINSINIKPYPIYDHWAITSFLKEYSEKGKYLGKEDQQQIQPMLEVFHSLETDKLPHCFVHGDITKTNIIKNKTGEVFIIDFAVANWYPRIQELAVLLCDLFYNPTRSNNFLKIYNLVIDEYQKHIKLNPKEINSLPNYIKLAHVMHILLANYEKVVNKNNSEENNYFLDIGRKGLNFTNSIW